MNKPAKPKRAGLLKRLPAVSKPLTQETMSEWAESLSNASLLADARRYLNDLESPAMRVFARHGLPVVNGCYRRPTKGGEWEAVSLASEPGGPWQPVGDQDVGAFGYQHSHLEALWKHDFEPNSEVGFAGVLLAKVNAARRKLDEAEEADDEIAIWAFNAGVAAAAAYGDWQVEFGLGDWIAGGRQAQVQRKKARARRTEIEAQANAGTRKTALELAIEARRSDPTLSQSSIAARLKEELGSAVPQHDGLVKWIRAWERDGELPRPPRRSETTA